VANERPNLVKSILNVEGAGMPFVFGAMWGLTDVPPVLRSTGVRPKGTSDARNAWGAPRRRTAASRAGTQAEKPAGIPIVVVTAESSGTTQRPPVVAFLKQACCDAEELQLKDKGILGNGYLMMRETNNRQVFDAIRRWLELKLGT
jgi:hypothetical protein